MAPSSTLSASSLHRRRGAARATVSPMRRGSAAVSNYDEELRHGQHTRHLPAAQLRATTRVASGRSPRRVSTSARPPVETAPKFLTGEHGPASRTNIWYMIYAELRSLPRARQRIEVPVAGDQAVAYIRELPRKTRAQRMPGVQYP